MGRPDRRVEKLARLFPHIPREEVKKQVAEMDRKILGKWLESSNRADSRAKKG